MTLKGIEQLNCHSVFYISQITPPAQASQSRQVLLPERRSLKKKNLYHFLSLHSMGTTFYLQPSAIEIRWIVPALPSNVKVILSLHGVLQQLVRRRE